ncbi:MAG: cytochrome c maturation protein CcmE [Rhodothalassiaceae bacterium]
MGRLAGNRAWRRKRRRLILVLLALAGLGAAAFLIFKARGDALLYFRLPSDVLADRPPAGERFRLGGLVAEGSVERLDNGKSVRFAITDGETRVPVIFTGILPDLFREGQGMIAEGRLGADGVFVADTVLAKHDETYMPREVYEKLRARGHPEGAESRP